MTTVKKILITGGSGFVGRNLLESLKSIYDVVTPSSNELNLLNKQQVREYLVKGKFDIVIHAAKIDDVKMPTSQYDILDGNLRMFYNLVECSEYFGKMIFFGSGAEYDRDNMPPFVTENMLGKSIPHDSYGFSKYIMADKAEHLNNIYELCLFGVYGKYEAWHRRFISNAICRSIHQLPIVINKNVYFDYLYIDDLCRLVTYFIDNEPVYKRYNVCRGEHIDLYSLAKMVKDITKNPYQIEVKEEGMNIEYSGDNKRLLNEVQQFSFTPYKKSIIDLSEYYRENIGSIDKRVLL